MKKSEIKFKQTDMGSIPEEWDFITWGDVSTLEYGKGLRDYSDNGKFPVFGTNGRIGYADEYLSEKRGVIIGRKGAYRGVHYSDVPFYVIDTAFYLKLSSKVDAKFAYYELLTEDINGLDSGSAIPSTTRGAFYGLHLCLPPLPEQSRIASILSPLDDKIELNRKINANLEKIASVLFKRWFVDFEFPDENGNPYKSSGGNMVESELGEIPEGWRVASLTEIVEVSGGGTPSTSNDQYWGGSIPWFSVVDAPDSSDVYVIETEKNITEEGLENCATKVLPEGTVIITARGTVGRVALVGRPMAMNQSCYGLKGRVDEFGYFIYFLVRRSCASLRQGSHGSVFDTITRETLANAMIIEPSLEIVKCFEDLIESLMKRMKNNFLQTALLKRVRDSFLPRLMSGRIRV